MSNIHLRTTRQIKKAYRHARIDMERWYGHCYAALHMRRINAARRKWRRELIRMIND